MLSCTHQQDSSKKARAFLPRLKNEQKIATSVFCREKCFSLVLILLARDSSALIQRMRGARRQKYVAKTKYKISYGGLPQVQKTDISAGFCMCTLFLFLLHGRTGFKSPDHADQILLYPGLLDIQYNKCVSCVPSHHSIEKLILTLTWLNITL